MLLVCIKECFEDVIEVVLVCCRQFIECGTSSSFEPVKIFPFIFIISFSLIYFVFLSSCLLFQRIKVPYIH